MNTNEIQDSRSKIPDKSKYPDPRSKSRGKYTLRKRLLLFSRRMLFVCKILPKIAECEGIRRQLARSATSIGANFEEADGALTKKDFINKTCIARKEAKETLFWLNTIKGIYIEEKEISKDIQESKEIVNILSSILINSIKSKQNNNIES